MKYVHYDEVNGKLLGWYDKDIHYVIPTPNIEVSDEDWKIAINANANFIDTTTKTLSVKDFRTAEELLLKQAKDINNAIQNHLDTTAQSLRYDNINAIGKYVGYENDFRAEAEKLGAWASSCWKVAGQIEADVQSGVRVMPTVDEVLAELPVYV